MAPQKQHNKRPSLADAFEGLEINSESSHHPAQADMVAPVNIIRSIRQTMNGALQHPGSIRTRSVRGVEASFTISMDESYDYNVLGDDLDPDDLHEELKEYLEDFAKALRDPSLDTETMDQHLSEMLARMVFSSNLIESAGGGLDVTLKLCHAIFQGKEVSEISERDPEYEALKLDLIRQHLPHGSDAVLRSRREIVQHAKAASYIIQQVYVNGEDLSEKIILQTHSILTHKVDTEQGIPWTEYSGVYRQCNVSAGLNEFVHPSLVPGAMRSMIRSMKKDLQRAVDCGEIDPIALAAKYCHTFVNIHPFVDGNGRTYRLILNALLLKYSGAVVCIGEQEKDREKYLEIAATGSMAEASGLDTEDLEEDEQPKHYKGLASFTLKHARDSMRKFANVLKGKQQK